MAIDIHDFVPSHAFNISPIISLNEPIGLDHDEYVTLSLNSTQYTYIPTVPNGFACF